jgi:hypothetical protein
MSINAISYLTGSTSYQTGMVKRATVGANMSSLLTGNFKWWNKVDALATQYLIYTDSYTTERTDQANSVPVCWSTPDLNDQSLINLINTIPERVGDLPFTNVNQALYWLQNTNKYFLLKNGYENIVTDGLVLNLDAGWYDSYPATGSVWTDLSGEGNNGTLTNGPTFNTDNGGSIVFDASDDYVNCGTDSSLNFGTGNFNVSCWIKTSNQGTSDYMGVVSKYDGAVGTGLWIQLTPTNRYVGFGWDGGTFLLSTTSVNNGNWRHISCQRTGAITAEIYVDGVLVSTGVGANKSSNTSVSLDVGRIDISGRYFNGNIAGVQLYGKSLTPVEIQQNYITQKTRFGLTSSPVITTNLNVYLDASNTASYPGSGNNWYDISGVNNSAELLNGPSFSTDGGGCINFDGTDDRARIPQNTDLYGNTFTWEFWVKFDAFPNTYSGIVWAEGSTGGGSGLQYLLSIQDNSGTRFFHYRVHNTVTGWGDTNTSTIDFTPTNWTHIVWTFDNGTTKIYTQGALFHTNTDRGPYNGGTDSPVFIAGRNDSFGSLDGKFAMVNHYTTALNGTQVTSNYNSTKSKFGY